MANGPTNKEVNIKEEENTSQEVNQSEIINTTAPVVEAPVETAPETVVQEAPVEEVNQSEIVNTTAPVKEEAPVVNQTAVDTEKELKSLDTLPLSNVIKDVFIKANEIGETKSQTVEKIKTRLAEGGYDVSNFEGQYGDLINDFDGLNRSEDDFFKSIQEGETFGKFFTKNSEDYNRAKQRVDSFNSVDKSPEGIKALLKSKELNKNSTLYKDLMNVPEYAEIIKEKQKEILKNKIDNTENLLDVNFGELDEIVEDKANKYVTSGDEIINDIDNDPELKKNKEGYLASTKELLAEYQKRKNLRNELRRKYPNASNAFIESLYVKGSSAIESRIGELESEVSLYETGYNLRMAEKEIGWDAKESEMTQKRAIFKDLFNKKWGDDRLKVQEERKIEQNNINNKAITKWLYKDDSVVGVDKFGNIVSTLEGYNNGASQPGEKIQHFGTKHFDDGSSTITYYNPKTKQISQQHFGKDEEELIVNDWIGKTGKISGYGGEYDNNTGLDVAINNGEDFTSPFNGTVLDYKENNGDYGNSLLVEDSEGNIFQYSHLKSTNLSKGDKVGAGSVLGQAGNTGRVTTRRPDGTYSEVTEQERAEGRGSHLDIVSWAKGTTTLNASTARDARDTERVLNGETIEGEFPSISISELAKLRTARTTKNKSDWTDEERAIAEKIETQSILFEEKYPEFTGILPTAMSVGSGVSDEDRRFLLQGTDKAIRENDITAFNKALARTIKVGSTKEGSPYANILGHIQTKSTLDGIIALSKETDPNIIKEGITNMYSKLGVSAPDLTSISSYKTFIDSIAFDEVLRLAGTSFTEGTVNEIKKLYPQPGDTQELIEKKIEGLRSKSRVGLAVARNIIDPDNSGVFEKIFPELTEGANIVNSKATGRRKTSGGRRNK